MAEYKLCFRVAGEYGVKMSFDSDAIVSYEDLARRINKEKVAELLCLSSIGCSAADIEIITPEQYEEEFGDSDDAQ